MRVVGLGRRRKFPSERRRRVRVDGFQRGTIRSARLERYPGRERERDDGLDVHLDDHRARLAEVTRGGGVALGDAHVALARGGGGRGVDRGASDSRVPSGTAGEAREEEREAATNRATPGDWEAFTQSF